MAHRLRRTRRSRVPHRVSAIVFRFDRRYAAEFALVFRLHQKEEGTRRMKKALTSVLLSLILTLTASGCAPELYERLLISAIGVDRTATGCRVTVLASETTEDGGQSTFSGEGDTVPEALSQIALESGRTPLYSHNAAILFGMQCAESGIAEQLDFFIRHYDSRPTAKVFLAEDTAESVLLQTDLTAERFMQLSNGAKYSGVAADVNLLQLVNGLYGVNTTATLPVLRADDLPTPVGTAVLQSNRLCAVLTPAETQGLSALQGTLSGGEFTVKDEAFGMVSLKVRSTNSNIIFTGTAEQPKFTAKIHVIAEVSAVTNTAKHVGNEAFPRFETALVNCIEGRLAAYLKNANGADAAGLSEVIFRTAPNVWREMGESRAEKLSKAEITFHVTAEVQRVEEEDIPYF
jgi:spore germination protein KC